MRVVSAETTLARYRSRASRGGTMFPHVPPPASGGVRNWKQSKKTEQNSKAKKAEAALDSASCGWHKAFPRGSGLPCALSWSVGGTRGRSPMASFGTFWTSKRYCPPRHEGQSSPLHGENNTAAALPQKQNKPCAQQHSTSIRYAKAKVKSARHCFFAC